MQAHPTLTVRLAACAEDRAAAERLRYEVFVAELGGDGPMVDHAERRERDAFDPYFDHLVLVDDSRPPGRHVVGAYRIMRREAADAGLGFYSAGEYDLAALLASRRGVAELGRSCIARELRGGPGMFLLWGALSRYAERHGIEVLFGVASFHGTDPAPLAAPLSLLHHRHLAPPALRVRARPAAFVPMDVLPPDGFDPKAAMAAIPPLIRAYLRVGGRVGEGAYVDRDFNTIDVCVVMDAAGMTAAARAVYGGRR